MHLIHLRRTVLKKNRLPYFNLNKITLVVSVSMSNIYLKGGFAKSFSLIFGFSKCEENI